MAYTKKQIMSKIADLHGNRYLYENFDYENVKQRINIECRLHGKYTSSIEEHLKGVNCRKCVAIKISRAKLRKINIEELKNKFNLVHKNFYNYDKLVYKGSEEKITISCPIHGDFEQTPYVHSKGHGCKKCVTEKQKDRDKKSRIKNFIERIKKKFGDDVIIYTETYINNQIPLKYKCIRCGKDYTMSPNKLLDKKRKSCSFCFGKRIQLNNNSVKKYRENLSQIDGTFYFVRLYNNEESFYKIGVTTTALSKRFEKIPYAVETVLLVEDSIYKCYIIEQEFLPLLKEFKYKPNIYFGGYTECLKDLNVKKVKDDIELRFLEMNEPLW